MSGPYSSPITGNTDVTLDGVCMDVQYSRKGTTYTVTRVWAGTGWIDADEAFRPVFIERLSKQLTREFAAEFAGQLEGVPA